MNRPVQHGVGCAAEVVHKCIIYCHCPFDQTLIQYCFSHVARGDFIVAKPNVEYIGNNISQTRNTQMK